jgi:hypothetical protein
MEGGPVRLISAFRIGVSAAFAALASAACLVVPAQELAAASSPPSAWQVASAPTPAASWYAVDFGAGRWVALGHGAEVAVSLDGSTWTQYPVPPGSWQSLTYGDGEFVALSSQNASPQEMVSSNGVNWTAVAGPAGQWTGLTYGAGRFVAVSSLGQIVTSSDAEHWTPTWLHSKAQFTSVAYGNGRFIAVDGAEGATVVSPNGVGWAYYPTPMSGQKWGAVAFGNGNFVAFDSSGSGYVATTVYGYVWTLHHYSPAQEIDGATFGCGRFVADGQALGSTGSVGSTGSTSDFISSGTGATWTGAPVPTDATSNWTAVAYGAHRFVAVDSAGDIASLQSAANCSATVPAPPQQVSGNIHNGEVWTYMHPPSHPSGAPIDGYRVTITDGTLTKQCHAPVYFEPNCIIKGLQNGKVYSVSAQSRNRYGYSVPTDPETVIPVAKWSLRATTTTSVVSESAPIVVQVTGVLANSEGIYPSSFVAVHFGANLANCRPSPFGECSVTITNPTLGPNSIYATYSGYGRSYRSPSFHVTVVQ